MRFHVLGVGSIGILVAHHLRRALPSNPITLIFRNAAKFQRSRTPPTGPDGDVKPPWSLDLRVAQQGNSSMSTNYVAEDVRGRQPGEQVPRHDSDDPLNPPPYGPIRSLLVTVKTNQTLPALSALKSRLEPSSVITLLQNGMGVYDELCSELWPDPATRPHFIIGSTTHGVSRGFRPDHVVYRTAAGEGEIKWGVVADPRNELDVENWLWKEPVSSLPILAPPPSPTLPLPIPPYTTTDAEPLYRTLTGLLSMSTLTPGLLPMPHLHHVLLLKLALNSIINPLTAVFGGGILPNGSLLVSPSASSAMNALADESSAVITAYLHSLSVPLAPPPDVLRLFSPQALTARAIALCRSTSENISSMSADVANGRDTEIAHINGYIVELGKRLNVDTPRHRMMINMVHTASDLRNPRRPASRKLLATMDEIGARVARQQLRQPPRALSPHQLALEERRLDMQEKRLTVEEDRLRAAKVAKRFRAKHDTRQAGMTKLRKHRDELHRLQMQKVEADLAIARKKSAWGQLPPGHEEGKEDVVNTVEDVYSADGTAPEAWPGRSRLSAAFARFARGDFKSGRAPYSTARQTNEDDASVEADAPRPGAPLRPRSIPTAAPSTSPAPSPGSSSGGGLAASMSELIGAAPRQDRYWDLTGDHLLHEDDHTPTPESVSRPSQGDSTPVRASGSGSGSGSGMTIGVTRTTVGLSATMSQLISAAPRLDRTWDEKGEQWKGLLRQSRHSTPRLPHASQSPPSSPHAPPKFNPESLRSASNPFTNSPYGSQRAGSVSTTSFSVTLDALITSAPRQSRTWDLAGDHFDDITDIGSSPKLSDAVGFSKSAPGGKDLSKGGLGTELDRLIAGAPRQERVWDVQRETGGGGGGGGGASGGGKRRGGGRFGTSKSSGS